MYKEIQKDLEDDWPDKAELKKFREINEIREEEEEYFAEEKERKSEMSESLTDYALSDDFVKGPTDDLPKGPTVTFVEKPKD